MTSILLKRDGAKGDVLLMTPIIKRLHKEGWDVFVETKCGEVLHNNPYVKKVFDKGKVEGVYERAVDLNLSYEKKPYMHIVTAYSLDVFGDTMTVRKPELFRKPDLWTISHQKVPYIVVHMGVGWENRTFSKDFWSRLISDLLLNTMGSGTKFVTVGQGADRHDWKGNAIVDMHGELSVHDLQYIIHKAKLFIGPDSFPLHVAQTTNTPSIGLFTSAKWEYRKTSDNMHPITPDISCYGCLHDEKPPVVYCGCRRKDFKCLSLITPQMVLDKAREILAPPT